MPVPCSPRITGTPIKLENRIETDYIRPETPLEKVNHEKNTERHRGLGAILEFNQDRKPGLLRLKLRKMRADPFTFFRGADHLFCRDWPELRPLDVGPDVLICGDLHLENFGAHRTTEGDFRYDLNDFDEAVVAACSFDVVRCATSIILASEQWKLKPSQATGMALAYLENYREAVKKAVETGSVHEIVPHGGHGPIQEILGSTAIATQAQLLKAKTRRKGDGSLLIRRTDTEVDISRKRFDKVAAALESYGQRLGKPDAFELHDLVFRIAGVGSLGVRRYLALVEGAGPPDGYHLLDIKECGPSAVAACATDTLHGIEGDEARRVVLSQTILQGHVAVGLDVLKIGQQSYRMRRDDSRREPLQLGPVPETAGETTEGRRKSRRADRLVPTSRGPVQARSRSLVRPGSMGRGPLPRRRPRRRGPLHRRTNRQHAEFQATIRDAGGISAALHAYAG